MESQLSLSALSEGGVPAIASSVFSLAYLGDAWYELWCRHQILAQTQKAPRAHVNVVGMVRCQTQAKLARLIYPLLTQEEQQIFQRGKNNRPDRTPKHATVKEYRDATGFECLLGYWYVHQKTSRFEELVRQESIDSFLRDLLSFSTKTI